MPGPHRTGPWATRRGSRGAPDTRSWATPCRRLLQNACFPIVPLRPRMQWDGQVLRRVNQADCLVSGMSVAQVVEVIEDQSGHLIARLISYPLMTDQNLCDRHGWNIIVLSVVSAGGAQPGLIGGVIDLFH